MRKPKPTWVKNGNLKPGRKPVMLKCKTCGAKLNKTEMRLHEPTCRRDTLIKVGARFTIRLKQEIVPVEIQTINADGSMSCLNLKTGHRVGVLSARRFRSWMDKAHIRYHRPEAEAEA